MKREKCQRLPRLLRNASDQIISYIDPEMRSLPQDLAARQNTLAETTGIMKSMAAYLEGSICFRSRDQATADTIQLVQLLHWRNRPGLPA